MVRIVKKTSAVGIAQIGVITAGECTAWFVVEQRCFAQIVHHRGATGSVNVGHVKDGVVGLQCRR